MSKKPDPTTVLHSLLQSSKSEKARKQLLAIHQVCDERHKKGELDFGVATIAAICQAKGFMNARAIYNKNSNLYRELINSWEEFADSIYADKLSNLPANHPEVVLRKIFEKSMRADKKRNLRAVHAICQKQHENGSLDYSFSTIGKLCEEAGILKRNSLSSVEFVDHRDLILSWDDFSRPWFDKKLDSSGVKKRIQKSYDLELTWVQRDYPELAAWRELAAEWLGTQAHGLNYRVSAVTAFFEIYLSHPDVPVLPKETLSRGHNLPDFRKLACPASKSGISFNNSIHEMIEWVLLRDFSIEADDGIRVVSPIFCNPIPYLRNEVGSSFRPDESVRSPLPYGYIEELRTILAPGPNFNDWIFAQSAIGAQIGELGAPGKEWFDVDEDMVDRSDPDCVFRTRSRTVKSRTKNVLQMWSPVRWVAVLIKLMLPLRTAQVRYLDSGEFDSEIFSNGEWVVNERALVSDRRAKRQQGVFRKNSSQFDKSIADTVLYINTNKTADVVKDGPDKGYVLPWHSTEDQVQNVYYWLEKLRNWQMKYNPVTRPTSWAELDARHVAVKSEQQLASYPDTSFLFRLPEQDRTERHLPVSDGIVAATWSNLLLELQERLAARGHKHADGSLIRLANRDGKGRTTTPFPLHSLRVSLVTALALDGEVPFPILQKLVGHSRLLMTLYYTKPGAAHVRTVLHDAESKLNFKKEQRISEFLLNSKYEDLVENAVCNNKFTVASAIAEHPASRNAAGWMLMHHGLCLVGGNASELEDNNKIGGCYNGGPNIGTSSKPAYIPTPGGSHNCVRCRWFITEPHYLPSLAAHFNTLSYHFDEARNKAISIGAEAQEMKRLKARMEFEADGPPFNQHRELQQLERLHEKALKRFSDLAEDLVACWRLIERCQEVLNVGDKGDGMQILVQGSAAHVEAIFEETESELLQLSGICESLQLYPDLDADKAVVRRSQLLDSVLLSEGLPPMFVRLSEREQLLAGNAFMRRLALRANPDNPVFARRTVIELMDAGKSITEHLGIDIGAEAFSSLSGGTHAALLPA
jgi:hypothetical protein